jgi:methylphosphotriester-DNA--protein-cysteine methyltransferase
MPKPTAIERAIKYIKANWRAGKTLKEVAELHGVNAGNLERAFRNREGVTIKYYVDQRRKTYVMAQLKNKTHFGYEIGAELGFANGRAFYRWVKRAVGVSFATLRSQFVTIRQQKQHDKKYRTSVLLINRHGVTM